MRNGKRVFLITREKLILIFNSYDDMDEEMSKARQHKFSNTMFWIPADATMDGL